MLLRIGVIAFTAAAFGPLLFACGPTVAIDDDGSSTTDATTTMPPTTAGSVTATTASTSASTSVSTTANEATSSEPTSSSADETSDDSSVTGFIQEPDGGICFTHCSYCDLWAQDCPKGEKCMPWANDGGDVWNANRCSPIDPRAVGIGDPCVVEGSGVSGIDNCGPSAMCWGVDPLTLEGTCVSFCDGSEANPQCADGLACMFGFDGGVIACLPACDPLASTCAADEVCAHHGQLNPIDHPFVCHPIPPFEPQPYGASCAQLDVCDDGLACVDAAHVPGCADLRCCTLLGDVVAPPVCPDVTQTCIPFDPDTMEGLCFCGLP